MSQAIEVSVDNQGCMVISADAEKRLGLAPGMTLVVEKAEGGQMCLRVLKELPLLVNKQGVLVVKAEAVGELEDVARQERDRRLSDLPRLVDR